MQRTYACAHRKHDLSQIRGIASAADAGESDMAKGQKRSTREIKKPKADKKAEPVAASSFLKPPAAGKKPGK